jgi:hypothetical protein
MRYTPREFVHKVMGYLKESQLFPTRSDIVKHEELITRECFICYNLGIDPAAATTVCLAAIQEADNPGEFSEE